ncbi:MAG: pectinesterase family protein [Tenericutes bacterium]|nr:pectinesterase family protein [Mycoplasmatota bacterium]
MIKLYLNPTDNIQEIMNGYPLSETLEIHLEPGVYVQKLRIKHNHLKIIGSKSRQSVISYNDYSYKMHEDGLLYNTFRTPTVMILGDYVELNHLTIENTAGSGLTIGQAIALSLYGNHTRVINCKLLGHQDTLFVGPLPIDLTKRYDDFLPIEERQTKPLHHYFKHCYIEGDVDFIFGSGTALFHQSTIVALSKGYIAATSTYQSMPYGLIFSECQIISKTIDEVYLARPWRDYGSSIFINSTFTGHFAKQRYDTWEKSNYRFFEYPYIESMYSMELKTEGMEQLKLYILDNFNCSIND